MKFELGTIEGFYGEPWSWSARREHFRFLKENGYSFYYYAPKADPYFRKKWREPFPADLYRNLEELIDCAHREGIEFGVGFSPYEIYLSYDDEAKARLQERIETFNRLKVDRLAILFDDMKGAPGLAQTQAEILHWVRDRSRASQLIMCPTYYSLDPVLDKIFGERPPTYLTDLGRHLDSSIGIVWTGEEVCSKSYTPEHIAGINEQVRRKVWLWDNYPVNDGPKMCKFLHLQPFRGRPAALSGLLQAHAVNPMNQPLLSRIPMLTLRDSYDQGPSYSPEASFETATRKTVSRELADSISADLELFSRKGYEQIDETARVGLLQRYAGFKDPVAAEIVRWLKGETIVTREVFLTQ